MSKRRIGVYVCHCGGNISDYVDVNEVAAQAQAGDDVVVAKTSIFACSDATQTEMENDIREHKLDGLVVASCSPKLHTFTFRGVAGRAGLNPFEYTQVNIREQCSWVHTDNRPAATKKAAALVNAGIARTRLTQPFEPLVVETTPKALVIGGGIAGLRAALGLAQIGLGAVLVEREESLGGWVGRVGPMFPSDRDGHELIAKLEAAVRSHPAITVFTSAELVSKSGSFGNYDVEIRVGAEPGQVIRLRVGSLVVATGSDTYQPAEGEFGYGIEGVVTLPEFKALVDASDGRLVYHGREVRSLAYIYCVGSRQAVTGGKNEYCSRYCCAATTHAAIQVSKLDPSIRQFHLYRDIRTYGKYEELYTEARKRGSVFMKFADDGPPEVGRGKERALAVTVRDLLTQAEELELPVDLVVLVTGMVPRSNSELVSALKLPVGRDGFFNEIHPKLRPVETVVDGVLIAGACQGPKTSAESVWQALAAVTQSAATLKRGFAALDPLVAEVRLEACTGCKSCLEACPYAAISMAESDHGPVAAIAETTCKGCGGCVPMCPENAIDLRGYTDAQVTAMIDRLVEVPVG